MPASACSQSSNHDFCTGPVRQSSPSGTKKLFVDASEIHFAPSKYPLHPFDSPTLTISCPQTEESLHRAVETLQEGNLVAFPTETVYGLGADARNSAAVKKIFEAKNRPSDNPLIVHFASLHQLRKLLGSSSLSTKCFESWDSAGGDESGVEDSIDKNGSMSEGNPDSVNPHSASPFSEVAQVLTRNDQIRQDLTPPISDIPEIYLPLIRRFWPGPLTILLDLPTPNPLSRNVTPEQVTVAVRIPDHPIALALIYLSDLPIAAPSANASGNPSPTTAGHVFRDLQNRIPLILDGGPSNVGLESTVVSGLLNPPRILRPGGVSVEEIRACGGPWANVIVNPDWHEHYGSCESSKINRNSALSSSITSREAEKTVVPLAPGMKYKHYSPKARVILYEQGARPPNGKDLARSVRWNGKVGILRTRTWEAGITERLSKEIEAERKKIKKNPGNIILTGMELSGDIQLIERELGKGGKEISQHLFGALRDLDDEEVEAIHIEGITVDNEGLAVMNRLRKAASVVIRKVG